MTGRKRNGALVRGGLLVCAMLLLGHAGTSLSEDAPIPETVPEAVGTPAGTPPAPTEPACAPGTGCVTHLPLPRFVSLKGEQGNARRGPGLTHRIDWIFSRPRMPLKVTAEYENWRRVEDQDGAGGWMHYALLSGTRTALVTENLAELYESPSGNSAVIARIEAGVVARLLECDPAWCRLSAQREKGWIRKSAIWGVEADETFK